MAKSLGASLFVYNALSQDYCIKEVIANMKEFADQIAIVDAGSTEQTAELIKSSADKKTKILCLPTSAWEEKKGMGREKLSYFSNIAHAMLDTDYFYSCQADEVIHENSFDAMRKAIETGEEGFLCTRINLWKDCLHKLNVPTERLPCSTGIMRLAKKGYQSWDDAEQLNCQSVIWFMEAIKVFHYGFVRKKDIMKQKVIHMQEQVFEMGSHDVKLDGSDLFQWDRWFSEDDLLPVAANEHPAIMQEWIKNHP